MEILFVLAAAGLVYLIVRKLKQVAETKSNRPPVHPGTGGGAGWKPEEPFEPGKPGDNVTF
jgi:hypothetical protein